MSEGVSDLNFLCLRDGTIFTLQERPKIPIDESAVPALVASDPSLSQELRPSFGYLALAVFEREHWKRIKSLKVRVWGTTICHKPKTKSLFSVDNSE